MTGGALNLSSRSLYRLDWAYRFQILGAIGRAYHVEALLRGVKVGDSTKFYGRPILQIHPGSRVEIGDNCVLVSNSRRCSTGNLYGPCRLHTDAATSRITIGRGSGLNGTSIWCRSTSVLIGEDVAIGPNVTIMDSPGHPLWPPQSRQTYSGVELDEPVVIADRVWVGNGALILPGATIGANSVIAARSVVTSDIPANCLAAGAPARVIRELGDPTERESDG